MFYSILKKKKREITWHAKLTPNHSKHDCDVKEKSYDMQKFTQNCSKHNCDVTSTNFESVKLRNGEICPEYSRNNYVSREL